MTGEKPEIQEREHTVGNIADQILAGNMKMLYNVRILRVFCPVPTKDAKDKLKAAVKADQFDVDPDLSREASAFPCGDYGWYECPERGDKVYSVLAPLSTRSYWLGMKYNPIDWQSKGKYNLEVEDFMCNMNLTTCEAQRYLQDCIGDNGQVCVLRDITRKVERRNDRTGEFDTLRLGIRDVIMPPTEKTEALTVETVGSHLLGIKGSPYSGHFMRDIPDEYLRQMAIPGGLGGISVEVEHLGKLELERRTGHLRTHSYQPEVATQPPAPPPVTVQPEVEASTEREGYYCSGVTSLGNPCRAKGVIKVDGKLYCQTHKDQGGIDHDA